jgi:type IV secretory pathway VirB10-like protein
MRTAPFKNITPPPSVSVKPNTEPAQLNQRSFESSIVRDLSEEIARPKAPAPAPKVEKESTPTPEATKSKTETTGSATLSEDVNAYKEKIKEEIKTTIEDPKRASKNVLRFINMGRFLLYPFLYKRIIFEETERNTIDKVLQKIAKASTDKKEPELDEFESRVYKKFKEYEAATSKVLWSETEIDQINEVAYLKLAEIKFLQWLMEHDWAIVIIIIESKRFVPVVGSRLGFGALDLSGL